MSVFICATIYFSIVLLLFPSPIAADYWIREMIVIKHDIASKYKNKNKIIVMSGSSTLFSIDTNMLTKELNLPSINYGLMVGLPIETIFNEIKKVVKTGDIIILPLEPDYYCKEENNGFREFEIRNAIAWNYEYWNQLNIIEKISSVIFMNARFPIEVLKSKWSQIVNPEILKQRLEALDDGLILKKFNDESKKIDENIYSIYNVDSLGNIRNTNDSTYQGSPRRADVDIKICEKTYNRLLKFTTEMKDNGVRIYFAHTPYVKLDDLDYKKIKDTGEEFNKKISVIAPMLDNKEELLFPLSSFLNTELHLNSIGRKDRTQNLIKSLNIKINDIKLN